jgi:hypothetical protein
VTTCRQELRELAVHAWSAQWAANPYGKYARRILIEPAKAVLDLHKGLHRAWSPALIQMQTGKIDLRGYLGAIKAAETAICPCNYGIQTVQHVLTECPRHTNLRSKVMWKDQRVTDHRRLLGSGPAGVAY